MPVADEGKVEIAPLAIEPCWTAGESLLPERIDGDDVISPGRPSRLRVGERRLRERFRIQPRDGIFVVPFIHAIHAESAHSLLGIRPPAKLARLALFPGEHKIRG